MRAESLRSEGSLRVCTRVPPINIHVLYLCVCVWVQRARVMCCGTWGLEVERDHLAACVPEDLRHVITGVHSAPFGVDTAHLTLVVAALMLRKITTKRETACAFRHARVCVCVVALERVCVRQMDCRTIFSVNSLGQAVPSEGERVCVRQSATVQRHTRPRRPAVLFRQLSGNRYG